MIYYLNKETVPTILGPHDCVIKRVSIQEDFIIFEFEDDISHYDSIHYINPKAKSLVIKIHLTDTFDTYRMKHYLKPWCKGTYARIDNNKLKSIAEKEQLTYLYHTVGYESIIIKLDSNAPLVVDINADYVEYKWIE